MLATMANAVTHNQARENQALGGGASTARLWGFKSPCSHSATRLEPCRNDRASVVELRVDLGHRVGLPLGHARVDIGNEVVDGSDERPRLR